MDRCRRDLPEASIFVGLAITLPYHTPLAWRNSSLKLVSRWGVIYLSLLLIAGIIEYRRDLPNAAIFVGFAITHPVLEKLVRQIRPGGVRYLLIPLIPLIACLTEICSVL